MNLKKPGKVLTSKSVGTGPSSYEKRIYRAAVSQRLRNTSRQQAHEGGKVTHRLPLPLWQEIFLALIYVRRWVAPETIVRPEGLC